MKMPVIYSIEYLMNNKDICDEDLHNLFDTKSLIYSLVIGEFREINSNLKDEDIINIIKNKNWQYKYYWNLKQFNSYKKKLEKVYHNIYYYTPYKSSVMAENFLTIYGLTNIKQKKYKKKYILND